MKDVQNNIDNRNINIDKVGIKNIVYPIIVMDKSKGMQHTVASINMFVQLPHNFKGTHMSRFIKILNEFRDSITNDSITAILMEMKKRLNSISAHVELSFPYFIEKFAPVTKEASVMAYNCKYLASDVEGVKDFITEVNVPILALCPCSKEISAYGAHNQRGIVCIKIRHRKMVWFEELILIAEESSSAPLYPLLKREDEKYITEKAYNSPVFVEDIVREISVKLNEDNRITWFEISCENYESIHNHSAYATIERLKEKVERL
jgi:GTP cyclohydrolase I